MFQRKEDPGYHFKDHKVYVILIDPEYQNIRHFKSFILLHLIDPVS